MRWRGFGFVHHSRTIFCHAVPNLSITIRNISIAVPRRTQRQWPCERATLPWVPDTVGVLPPISPQHRPQRPHLLTPTNSVHSEYGTSSSSCGEVMSSSASARTNRGSAMHAAAEWSRQNTVSTLGSSATATPSPSGASSRATCDRAAAIARRETGGVCSSCSGALLFVVPKRRPSLGASG
jgi:hypothetical protein